MTSLQWKSFCDFKDDFKEKVAYWKAQAPELSDLQKAAVEKAGGPLYSFETSVVYNKALDDVKESDEIKLIVIGDNPGKDEQLEKNNRYLVGQAGKIGEGYFRRNPELGVDFRKNVIILNKTPVHSGKTVQLKTICTLGGEKIKKIIQESQIWMAERTARLHVELCQGACKNENDDARGAKGLGNIPEIWLVGYSELKDKGIFMKYRDCLKNFYSGGPGTCNDFSEYWEKVYVFQHFSMNRFSIDLNDFIKKGGQEAEERSLVENIHLVGKFHRKEIFRDE